MIQSLGECHAPNKTPRKVIHVPESVRGQNKVPDWQRAEIDQHPSDVGDLSRRNDDQQTGQTKNKGEQDQRHDRLCGSGNDGENYDIDGESDGGGQNERSNEFHEHDKLHGETECTAEIPDEHELSQVVNSRVDPSSSLREQNAEGIRYDRLAYGLRAEHHLSLRECLEHERR